MIYKIIKWQTQQKKTDQKNWRHQNLHWTIIKWIVVNFTGYFYVQMFIHILIEVTSFSFQFSLISLILLNIYFQISLNLLIGNCCFAIGLWLLLLAKLHNVIVLYFFGKYAYGSLIPFITNSICLFIFHFKSKISDWIDFSIWLNIHIHFCVDIAIL